VVAPEPLSAEVGVRILREGGNAVDAAVAVQFALAVTFPNAGNLGGGGFMLVHMNGADTSIDYRETAPSAATRDMFVGPHGEVVTGESLLSHRASGVPGSVAGMWLAHQKFGTLPWKRLVQPALLLARDGWTLDERSARSFKALRKNNAPRYFHGEAGTRFVQEELARTLERIGLEGRDGFYKGLTARQIALEMERGGGLITAGDLEGYQAKVRPPLEGTYRGLRVVSMPPPSSGGVALLELLNMLEPRSPGSMGFGSVPYLHLAAEMEKRVFADRSEYLGDPDFVGVPAARLSEKAYAARRMEGFREDERTSPDTLAPGRPTGEKEETTHFSIVDKWGNAVANTTTLNDSYGSGVVVQGAGFLLNNEMDDFSAKPGVPNLFGVTGGEANAIAPGKRMLSSMSPTFVFKEGKLWLVLGTPGGPTIFTTVFQTIVNRVDFEMPLAKSVAAPRFHHQWPPVKKDADPLWFEELPPPEVRGRLEMLGYQVVGRSPIGDMQAIELGEGEAVGSSDPRGRGKALLE
jgi:gamma-glutamyltranspeptidase/glutathione hydrolase